MIAFESVRGDNQWIYVMNADGSGERSLTRSPAADGEPAWSPDGRRIAFSRTRVGERHSQIYGMNADGSGQTRLSENGDGGPAWSPDGRKIAFGRDVPPRGKILGGAEIWVMNADGSGQRRLTRNPSTDKVSALDCCPAWSPDGHRIAFATDRDGDLEIWVMNADGSGQRRRTNDPGRDVNPAWQPAPGRKP